jgi:hypothetical protein
MCKKYLFCGVQNMGGPPKSQLEAMYFSVGLEVVGPGRQLGGSGHNEMSRNHSTLKNLIFR